MISKLKKYLLTEKHFKKYDMNCQICNFSEIMEDIRQDVSDNQYKIIMVQFYGVITGTKKRKNRN